MENTDHAALATRVIRGHATQTAVHGIRVFGYSWGEIDTRLGTTRQAARQRSSR